VSDVLDVLLRSVPILIGGGIVQFLIFMLRRRAEIKALDVSSAKVESEAEGFTVQSAAQSVALANLMRNQAEERVTELEGELESRDEQARLLAQDKVRLKARLARAETDLAVARAIHDRTAGNDDDDTRSTPSRRRPT
jgi:hypothetical protein